MVFSQFNRNVSNNFEYLFVRYKNVSSDGTTKLKGSVYSYNQRTESRYGTFFLELVC